MAKERKLFLRQQPVGKGASERRTYARWSNEKKWYPINLPESYQSDTTAPLKVYRRWKGKGKNRHMEFYAKYADKPEPTKTIKDESTGRERKFYGANRKKEFREYAEGETKSTPKKQARLDEFNPDELSFEDFVRQENLKAGVKGFAEHYGTMEDIKRIEEMRSELLQKLYDTDTIIFEYYFQYTDVGYDEETGEFISTDYYNDQFAFLIDKYNELAEQLGYDTV